MLTYIFVLVVGLVAGTLSGIIGTGASIMLLPVLVIGFGAKQAVPIMAIAAVMNNIGKAVAWWREIDWRACVVYSITGIPGAALGARTLVSLPEHAVDAALGAFFLLMIPLGHWLHVKKFSMPLWQLAVVGLVVGFLTGIVVSTGPLSVPAFTAYGLVKGAFIATEAASSLMLYISKIITFRGLGALPVEAIAQGLITGSSLIVGAFAAKWVVLRMSQTAFRLLLDALLLVSGTTMLVEAFL